MSFFSQILQKLTTKESKAQKSFEGIYNDLGIFEYFNDGFYIKLEDSKEKINWQEIDQINVYKKDVFVYDLVMMEIIFNGDTIKIHEETPGWFQFNIKLKDNLKSIQKDWGINITQPPFAQNFTTIYLKEKGIVT